MSNRFLERLGKQRLSFDGGTGSVLLCRGLRPGEGSEVMNDRDPETVVELHRSYVMAGADIVKTNTFGINKLKYSDYDNRLRLALALAKRAVEGSEALVAFDIGPTGRLLEPLGSLSFDDAVDVFRASCRVAEEEGADLILIETMSDLYEVKAAVIGAKEGASLPIAVTCAFDERGRLMTGADVACVAKTLEALGVSCLGVNCSFGPDAMLPLVSEFREATSLPVIVNPNAGLPTLENGRTVYNVSPEDFANSMRSIVEKGASLIGGCCGTNPDYIRAALCATADLPVAAESKARSAAVTSFNRAVDLCAGVVIVGDRIRPGSCDEVDEALSSDDVYTLVDEVMSEEDCGAQIIGIRVDSDGACEEKLMQSAIKAISEVCSLPLMIESDDERVISLAMRIYNGAPLVRVRRAEESFLRSLLPEVKKYGASLVLPLSADGSDCLGEAEALIGLAAEYGISCGRVLCEIACTENAPALVATLKAKGMGCAMAFASDDAPLLSAALRSGLDIAFYDPTSSVLSQAFDSLK